MILQVLGKNSNGRTLKIFDNDTWYLVSNSLFQKSYQILMRYDNSLIEKWKGFNGRSAVEEYISTHPLSFSTPDLILKEFVIWLSELVDDPHGKGGEKIPRIILYTSGKEKRGNDSLGSVSKGEKDQAQNNLFRSPATTMETSTNKPSSIFCIECGSKLNSNSKFCTKCGTKQKTI